MNTVSVIESHSGQVIKDVADPVDAQDACTKHYADLLSAGLNAIIFKGTIDASGNPNYPAADRGWAYIIKVAGKIGGALGEDVLARDLIICLTNGTPSGTQAEVGDQWVIVHANVDGSVTGPLSSIDGDFAQWDGTTGIVLKDGGLSLDTDDTLAADSDSKIPSQKAVKAYVDGQVIPPPTGQALTRTNDTNVTITLGGTPTTALLQAVSIAVGWSGKLASARGGVPDGGTTDQVLTKASNTDQDTEWTTPAAPTGGRTVTTLADSNTIDPDSDYDVNVVVNTQSAGAFTVNAPSGTPSDVKGLLLRIKTTNVHTFVWNAIFRPPSQLPLPTTLAAGKSLYAGFVWNDAASKWDLSAVMKEY